MTVNTSALVSNVSLAIGLLGCAALAQGCGGKTESGGISLK